MKTNKFLIFWLLCSFLSYGASVGYFRAQFPKCGQVEWCNKWDEAELYGIATVESIFGPISLVSYVIERLIDNYDWKKLDPNGELDANSKELKNIGLQDYGFHEHIPWYVFRLW